MECVVLPLNSNHQFQQTEAGKLSKQYGNSQYRLCRGTHHSHHHDDISPLFLRFIIIMNSYYTFWYSPQGSKQEADHWAWNLDWASKLLQILGFLVALALSWFAVCLYKARKKFVVLRSKGIVSMIMSISI